MNKALWVILATVTLDAAGIGLTMPIIPRLLRDVGHIRALGWRFGVFLGLVWLGGAVLYLLCLPVFLAHRKS